MLLLAACKMNMSAELHYSTIQSTALGAIGSTTPVRTGFQIPGLKVCDDFAARVLAIMQDIVADVEASGCQIEGTDSFLYVNFDMPYSKDLDISNALLGVTSIPHEDTILVRIHLDRDKYVTLVRRMNDEFDQTVDLATSRMAIRVINNSQTPIRLISSEAFINGVPVPAYKGSTIRLEAAQSVLLVPSNVGTATLVREGELQLFEIPRQ